MAFLRSEKRNVAFAKMDRKIGSLIVDEQDAGFEQSLVNQVYYSLSDLVLYLRESHTVTIDYILEEALESFRYEASNDYLKALGVQAVVQSDSFDEKIECDPRVATEKIKQSEDMAIARQISDWTTIRS